MHARLMAALFGVWLLLLSSASHAQVAASAAPSATASASPSAAVPVGSSAAPSAPGATASPTASAGAADAGAAISGEQYVVRLRDLEQRINELKEEIFRSKARLSLLAESVLQNVVGGARAIIQHENEMGGSFRLVRAVYALDGAPILTRADDNGSLADQHDFPVYNGQIGAGDHTVTVNLEYQGNGFGIFSYVKGYTFRVRSTQSFSVQEGKAIQIRVVGYEKGGPTTPPEERPAIRYIQRIMNLRDVTDTEPASNQPAQGGNNASGSGSAAASGAGAGAGAQGEAGATR